MVDQPMTDFARLDEDLRAVCARHGLLPAPGEEVRGWVGVVGVAGVFADGREYTRTYCITSTGMARCDVERLLVDGQHLLASELSPRLTA